VSRQAAARPEPRLSVPRCGGETSHAVAVRATLRVLLHIDFDVHRAVLSVPLHASRDMAVHSLIPCCGADPKPGRFIAVRSYSCTPVYTAVYTAVHLCTPVYWPTRTQVYSCTRTVLVSDTAENAVRRLYSRTVSQSYISKSDDFLPCDLLLLPCDFATAVGPFPGPAAGSSSRKTFILQLL
jgi:hypothetical protein